MANPLRPYVDRLPSDLDHSQTVVSSGLAPIFPFYTAQQLNAVVQFQSDELQQPVDSQILLNRCIDFVLDNPDAMESALVHHPFQSSVIDILSDDDDSMLLYAANQLDPDVIIESTSHLPSSNSSRSCEPKKGHNNLAAYKDDLPIIILPKIRSNHSHDKAAEHASPGLSGASCQGIQNVCPKVSSTNVELCNQHLISLATSDFSIRSYENCEDAGFSYPSQDTISVPRTKQNDHVNTFINFGDATTSNDNIPVLPSNDDTEIAGSSRSIQDYASLNEVFSPTQAQINVLHDQISLVKHLNKSRLEKSHLDSETHVDRHVDTLPGLFSPKPEPKETVIQVDSKRSAPVEQNTFSFRQYVHNQKMQQSPRGIAADAAQPSNAKTVNTKVILRPSKLSAVCTVTTNKEPTGGSAGAKVADVTTVPEINPTVQNVNNTSATPGNIVQPPSDVRSEPAQPPTAPAPPIPAAPKSVQEQIEDMKLEVLQLFPRVDLQFLDSQLRIYFGPYAVNNVCSDLLERPDYPRSHETEVQDQRPEKDCVDYYKDYGKVVLNMLDRESCLRYLQGEFQRISVTDIRTVLNTYDGHYAPTYKVLNEAMQKAYAGHKAGVLTSDSSVLPSVTQITISFIDVKRTGAARQIRSKLLKNRRSAHSGARLQGILKQEYDFVKRRIQEENEKDDYKMAWQMNEAQYEEDGQTIECGCCFCESSFENMVQCTEGHLFCCQCLLNYAKEAIFGSGKLSLVCMTTGCGATYPQSEMIRAVPSAILSQYDDRVQEENLNLADLSDLVRCPHCNYAAIMDNTSGKVFQCQDKECMKETCRLCKEDWAEHIGLPCDKVEKKDETKLRREYEERMTEAKVRKCHQCKSKFTKDEGCNKMTCTCRATMCYICKKPNIDYNHFCRHPRDPGQTCKECKACSLWTNPDEDDKRAIEEIQKEAQEKRKEQGYEDVKVIGAPAEPPAAKKRKQ